MCNNKNKYCFDELTEQQKEKFAKNIIDGAFLILYKVSHDMDFKSNHPKKRFDFRCVFRFNIFDILPITFKKTKEPYKIR